jgi:hypothetical protein
MTEKFKRRQLIGSANSTSEEQIFLMLKSK